MRDFLDQIGNLMAELAILAEGKTAGGFDKPQVTHGEGETGLRPPGPSSTEFDRALTALREWYEETSRVLEPIPYEGPDGEWHESLNELRTILDEAGTRSSHTAGVASADVVPASSEVSHAAVTAGDAGGQGAALSPAPEPSTDALHRQELEAALRQIERIMDDQNLGPMDTLGQIEDVLDATVRRSPTEGTDNA